MVKISSNVCAGIGYFARTNPLLICFMIMSLVSGHYAAPEDYDYGLQPSDVHYDKRSEIPSAQSNEMYLANVFGNGKEVDLCSRTSLTELVPRIINMKRMIFHHFGSEGHLKRDVNVAIPQWRILEWARQLHDIEKHLAFCNRRNNVSKLRLL